MKRDAKKGESNTAIFAAGCFWGVQFYFDQVPGVTDTEVGYIGGRTEHPTYEQVCYEGTGHAEAVRLTFDLSVVTYAELLKQFFRMHDPTQLDRQGPDVGNQYRSAIFYLDDVQKKLAEAAIKRESQDRNIATTLEPAGMFWVAEDFHQKFSERTGRGMCHVAYAPV
jgi:methionine-S-sulfoxide reductase